MRTDVFEAIFMTKKEKGKINYSKIAKQYNCDWRTVKHYYEARDQNPTVRKSRNLVKVTDGFETLITQKFLVEQAPVIEIYNVLKKNYGYLGSYTTLKRFTKKLKDQEIQKVTMHFETNPGFQCQIDRKESLKLKNKEGKVFEINIFLAVLGYSRFDYIELTLDKTQPTLFKCLTNLFKRIKGVPKQLLFDNMKTVVDRSRTQFGKPVYNQTFYAFSKDSGFIPKSCLAFRPQTKGKVENLAKIMNRLKAYNYEFDTIQDLEKIVKNMMNDINERIHQTTKSKPSILLEKEKEYFNPEPNYDNLETYFSTKPLQRKVPKDSLITFQNKKYSVPPKYVGKIVTLLLEGSNLSIYYNGYFVCSHQIADKKINYLPEHYLEIAGSTLTDTDAIEAICTENLNIFDKL